MAITAQVTTVKDLPTHKGPLPGLKLAVGPVTDLNDQVWSFMGTDKQGSATDISAVAVPSFTVDNSALCTADAPVGQSINLHYLGAGTVNVTFTETWNDGSIGPFSLVIPIVIGGSAATGFTATPGTPVVRP